MGDYYNVTRGPLSLTLNDGSAASVTPKKWIYISKANEGSASLQHLLQKGFLVRASVSMTSEEAPAPAAPPAAPLAPVSPPDVVPDAAPAPISVEVAPPVDKSEVAPATASKGDRSSSKSR